MRGELWEGFRTVEEGGRVRDQSRWWRNRGVVLVRGSVRGGGDGRSVGRGDETSYVDGGRKKGEKEVGQRGFREKLNS